MKFELTNMRQQITDEDLLNNLRTVANNLGKRSLKQRDYDKINGAQFSRNALRRFGNWQSTLEKAGLEVESSSKGMEYGEKEIRTTVLIDDLKRIATELNKPDITADEYDALGSYSSNTMKTRFGSWNKAKLNANLSVTRVRDNSNEELLQNILNLWMLIGRQPKYGEVISPNSKFHVTTYERRFGTWRAALEAFIDYVNTESNSEIDTEDINELVPLDVPNDIQIISTKILKIKKTSRNINLRMRWIILKGDNFCCRKCGRSPAKDPSIVLHIDHVLPWSRGGETVLENLETLCDRCNLGKSNL